MHLGCSWYVTGISYGKERNGPCRWIAKDSQKSFLKEDIPFGPFDEHKLWVCFYNAVDNEIKVHGWILRECVIIGSKAKSTSRTFGIQTYSAVVRVEFIHHQAGPNSQSNSHSVEEQWSWCMLITADPNSRNNMLNL